MSEEKLKRSISLPLITFYGLGTILGAGVYVLIGKVAGMAGYFAPIAFIVAALVAGFTAFAYCELSSRYPRSSGETIYLQEAFNQKWLSTIVGCLVILTGVVSGLMKILHAAINKFSPVLMHLHPISSLRLA